MVGIQQSHPKGLTLMARRVSGYLSDMESERPDDVHEAKAAAQRRSLRAAVIAIETYLATRAGKDEGTDAKDAPLGEERTGLTQSVPELRTQDP
jgi:hypothetical protein